LPVLLLAPIAIVTQGGCKKEEPPPPLPSAAPATTPAAPLELAPEQPVVVPDASAAPKKGGPGRPAASLKACCAALRQNAESAPEPNKAYMLSAAQVCDTMALSGGDKTTIMPAIQGALKSAGMPMACK
jgi:hypothetical protein